MNAKYKALRKALHKACREDDVAAVREIFSQAPELQHDADGFSFAAGRASVEIGRAHV